MFFLHHSQVDRLLAFWCSIYNDYVPGIDVDKPESANIDTGNHCISHRSIPPLIPADWIDLSPFWNSDTTYWTSKTVRNHEALGYTYPEYLNLNAEDDLRQHLIRTIDDLYGEHNKRTFDFLYNLNATSNDSHDAWTIRIHIKPFEIDRSYAVAVFLDGVPPDASEWFTSPKLVGSFDVFINYTPAECENCRDHQEVPIEGFVHLTSTLKRVLGVESLRDRSTVGSQLEQRFYIGIQKVGTIFVRRHSQYRPVSLIIRSAL
jgi:tyrosinase